jgi:hypothetical protein
MRFAVTAALVVLAVLGSASESQALLVRDNALTVTYFTGDACGDTDQGVLTLPRRSRAIRVTGPTVGDALFDDDGRPVAAVTAVRVHGQRVVVTARGAHDVCDTPDDFAGWTTAYYDISAHYTVDRKVIVFSCGNARIKPGQIVIACGDGNYGLQGMRWSRWGGRVATGHGHTYANDCIPFCAGGHFHSKGARVRLSRPRYCSSVDRWNYTRMTISARGRRRQRIWLGWICHSGFAGKFAVPVQAARACGSARAYKSIIAHGTSCRTARRVANGWANSTHCGPRRTCHVHGYTCTLPAGTDNYSTVRCRRGSRRVYGHLKYY